MEQHLHVLRASVDRLHELVSPLADAQLEAAAYPSEWSVADVMSHIGSSAEIMRRRLDDALLDQPTSDDLATSIWAIWNAKSLRAKADDGLAADHALVERIGGMSAGERNKFRFELGGMTFDATGFVALRLNEHTLHTWDIAVVGDRVATLPHDATALVIDNLELIARFTARPTGTSRAIVVRTTDPERHFTIALAPDKVTFAPERAGPSAQLELPGEAFIRLVYGRLDPDHTPVYEGDPSALDELRHVFPGP